MLTAMHLYPVYQMEKQARVIFCLVGAFLQVLVGFFFLEALITRCERRSH